MIPPGVDLHAFRPFQRGEKKVITDLPDRYIFCLSRVDANKGHDLLLNAFDLVRNALSDIHLVIGGGSPKPQQTELEVLAAMGRIIDEKGMHEKVHIVGYVPDELLVPFYQQAELFVLPSIFEPFGMTTIEAMACGKPVVASKLGGIRNVISSGENGFLIDPSNFSEFADAMIRLLNDKQLAESVGKEGNKIIQKHFGLEGNR